MGMNNFSNIGSFEEMTDAQDSAPETAATVEAEITTEPAVATDPGTVAEATTDATPVAEAEADNVETPKNN